MSRSMTRNGHATLTGSARAMLFPLMRILVGMSMGDVPMPSHPQDDDPASFHIIGLLKPSARGSNYFPKLRRPTGQSVSVWAHTIGSVRKVGLGYKKSLTAL